MPLRKCIFFFIKLCLIRCKGSQGRFNVVCKATVTSMVQKTNCCTASNDGVSRNCFPQPIILQKSLLRNPWSVYFCIRMYTTSLYRKIQSSHHISLGILTFVIATPKDQTRRNVSPLLFQQLQNKIKFRHILK